MKNKQAIYLLFVANSISGFAQGLSMIAIPWYFATVLEKASFFGVVYGIVTFISLFWGLYAGSLVDKYNRKRIFLIANLTGGMIISFISLTGFIEGELGMFLAAIAFANTFMIYNIHFPTLYAFAQEISDQKDYGRVTSYIEIQNQSTNALAGAVAGVLLSGTYGGKWNIFGFELNAPFEITAWNLHDIFLLDGITYFISFLLILFIRFSPVSERTHEPGSVLKRIMTGFHFLKKNPLIFIFGNASHFIFVTVLTANFFLLPVYVNKHLNAGAGVFAASEMYFALGSILAGMGVRWIFRKTNVILGAIILSAVATFIYVYSTINANIFIFYIMYLLLGFSNAGTRIMRLTFVLNHIPNQVIGRAGSVFMLINVLMRLGLIWIFSIPFFEKSNHVIYAFGTFGGLTFTAVLILLYFYRKLIRL